MVLLFFFLVLFQRGLWWQRLQLLIGWRYCSVKDVAYVQERRKEWILNKFPLLPSSPSSFSSLLLCFFFFFFLFFAWSDSWREPSSRETVALQESKKQKTRKKEGKKEADRHTSITYLSKSWVFGYCSISLEFFLGNEETKKKKLKTEKK